MPLCVLVISQYNIPYIESIMKNYIKDMFESISDYRKKLLLLILIQNDKDLLREIGFSERDINLLKLEFKNMKIKQLEEYLDYVKNEEQSIIERFSNKLMEKDNIHLSLELTISNI